MPPWNVKLKSMLFDFAVESFENQMETMSSFGLVTSVSDRSFEMLHAPFRLYEGFKLAEPQTVLQVEMCESFEGPIANTWVGFKDARLLSTDPMKLFFHQHTALWEVPQYEKSMPVSFGHLFSGAYCGWSRALEWTFTNEVKHFVLDNDHEAMTIWQLQSGARVFQDACGSPGCTDLKYGIFMDISENWFGLCRHMYNLSLTLSPPCVSWSMGGKGEGLACATGIAFWEGVQAVKWVRPISALFECVDATCSHPHYKLIQHAAKAIGYRILWSQVVRYDSLAPMNRNRWLAVWVRNDVPTFPCVGTFKLVDVQKKGWDDDVFRFFIPSQIKHQLVLNNKLLSIYGDSKFLPVSLRGGHSDLTQQQVLQRRCVDRSHNMPTLTASYSN